MLKKKKGIWCFYLFMLLITQWAASHLSLWEKDIGEFKLESILSAGKYFGINPFKPRLFLNLYSFAKISYIVVYFCFFLLFLYILMDYKKPRGDSRMKGIEHGSNHFMTKEEVEKYKKTRVTKDFPYTRDCTKKAI